VIVIVIMMVVMVVVVVVVVVVLMVMKFRFHNDGPPNTDQVQDVRTEEGCCISHHMDGRHSLTSDLGGDQFCSVLCS
jgi:hypothetical protein